MNQQLLIRSFFRSILVFTALIWSALSLASISSYTNDSQISLTEEEKTFLQENPVIKVHNEQDWPPFNFAEKGVPLGFSIDYMNLIAEKIGFQVEYVTGPSWNEFLEMMKAGTLDVMLNIVKTPERMKYLLYTSPYADNPNAILSKKDTPYKTIESLFGKTVAVPKGFFTEEILRKDYPQIKLLPLRNMLETMKAVTFGDADAALGELAVFNHLLNEHMMSDLMITGEAMMGDPEFSLLNIATRKDLPVLASMLRKGVDAITIDEKRQLQSKWLDHSGLTLKISLTEEEKSFLESNPVIKVHNEQDWPPFNFAENGKPLGFSIDYMNLIAKKAGFKVEYVTGPSWNEFLDMMKAGTLDVMLNIVKTPERVKYLLYTEPYADNPNAILSKKDRPYKYIESLFGKTVAVPKGFFTEEILRKDYPQIKLLPLRNMLETMKAVTFGDADAALGELAVFNHLLKEHMMSDLVISGEAMMGDPEFSLLNIATRKDLPILATILRKGVDSITIEEKRALQNKWFGGSSSLVAPNALSDKEKQFIREKGKVRFRVRTDRAPYEFMHDGVPSGIAVDYVKAAAEKTGLKVGFVFDDSSFPEAIDIINSERETFDTLLYAVATKKRAEELSFGDPYLAHPLMIVTHKASGYVADLADLKGKSLVIEKGFITNKWIARDYPEIKVVNAATTQEALKMVLNKEVDAYIGNMAIVNYMTTRLGMSDLQITAPSGYDAVKFSFVAPKEWPELASILSKGLRQITSEEHSEIQQKWFSLQVVEKFDYTKLIYISLFFIAILLVILYKNRSIKQINAQLELSHNEIAKKNRLLEELAISDNLTKLYNRHKLDEVLISESNRANRNDTSFGVIIIDVDNFKSINDTHGHQIGDEVLKEFALALKEHSRKTDIIGRWGGEEFLIICTEMTREGMLVHANNLTKQISSFPFSLGEHITASMGVSMYKKDENIVEVIKRADDALYKAKENGKDRVEYQ